MIKIYFSNSFEKDLRSLEEDLQDEVFEKVEMLKNRSNHNALKVHKSKGALVDKYSFSVNYKFRIIFDYMKGAKGEIRLHAIGGHEIYKK